MADSTHAVGGESASIASTLPSCWDKLCNEYADIFETPGMPPERAVTHVVVTEPNATVAKPWIHQISPTELAKVRW